MVPEEVRDLAKLSARELAQRLARYIESCGGLISEVEKEIAREAVRRARLAGQAGIRRIAKARAQAPGRRGPRRHA